MAIAKVILNGVTQMDVTQKTVTAGSMLSGTTALKNDGMDITGNIASKTSADLTASGATVTAPAGYYASAASKSVPSGSAKTPATTITANPTVSVNSSGLITATVSKTQSVTPTVSAGYVASGTAGTITVSGSGTSQLTTQAAQTIHPSTTDQTIASGRYLTGAQTIKAVTTTNLTAENIVSGVTVKVGDSTDDDCVTSVTGTASGGATNFVQGTFTTSSTGGVTQSISIPYSGNGHPISWTIEPTGGFYGNEDFYNLIQRFVTVIYCGIKSDTNTPPVWTNGSTTNQDSADAIYMYKNSTSNNLITATAKGQPTSYAGTGTAYGNESQVIFKNATTMCIYVASTSYGFAPNIEYTYRIVYSE